MAGTGLELRFSGKLQEVTRRYLTGECSWEIQLEGSEHGLNEQKQKLIDNAVADPTRSYWTGMALQSCPKLRHTLLVQQVFFKYGKKTMPFKFCLGSSVNHHCSKYMNQTHSATASQFIVLIQLILSIILLKYWTHWASASECPPITHSMLPLVNILTTCQSYP